MLRAMTIAEKILARASGRKRVEPGNYVTARIDMAMMPDAFRLIRPNLKQAGIPESEFKLWDPDRVVIVTDHRVPAFDVVNARAQKMARDLARSIGVKHFYDIFPGVCHQVIVEKGHVLPGELIV